MQIFAYITNGTSNANETGEAYVRISIKNKKKLTEYWQKKDSGTLGTILNDEVWLSGKNKPKESFWEKLYL